MILRDYLVPLQARHGVAEMKPVPQVTIYQTCAIAINASHIG